MEKIKVFPSVFFPGSVVTTRFGWDKDPPGPRIHHAVDRAGKGTVSLPIEAERVEWIDADGQGNSVIRAFSDGGNLELRMLHFIKEELDPKFLELALKKAAIPAGTPIGPVGNKGLFVAGNGGTGRHVHYSLMLAPKVYDDYLDEVFPGWDTDKSEEYAKLYGSAFIVERARRQITWYSDRALAKMDPWTGKTRYIVDSLIFGM